MMRLIRWRPRLSLAGTLLLIALPILAGGTILSLHAMRQNRMGERSGRGATLAALLARALGSSDTAHPEDFDNSRLLRLVEYTVRDLGLEYVQVVDREGRVLGHTDERFLNTQVEGGVGVESALTGRAMSGPATGPQAGRQVMEYASPLFSQEGPAAAVVVALRPGFSAVRLADFRTLLLPGLGMLLLIPFTFVMVRFSVRPLLATGHELRALLAAQNIPGLPALCGSEPGTVAAGVRELVREMVRAFQSQEEKRQGIEVEARVHEFERRRLEAVLEHLPEGIVLEGPDGQVEMINRAAENILGIKRSSILGAAPGIVEELLLPPPDAGQDAAGRPGDASWAAAADSRENGRRLDEVSTAEIPLYDGQRTPVGTLHLLRDLSGQHLVEQAQHEFVCHLAHEVKSPINSIRSYAEMLLDGEVDDRETRKEFFNTINEEAGRLSRLVENLLSLSKIEMGQVRLDKQFVKTRNLIEHAQQAVTPLARAKGLEFRVELPDRLGSLAGDRQLLEVALINVVGNAVKYTPAGGQVTLAVEETADRLLMRVADTGPGIRPEDQPRVFEKFYRSTSPDIAVQPGHGLGLALTKEILELHGGSVALESTPGVGSTFTLAIPLDTERQSARFTGETSAPAEALVSQEA